MELDTLIRDTIAIVKYPVCACERQLCSFVHQNMQADLAFEDDDEKEHYQNQK